MHMISCPESVFALYKPPFILKNIDLASQTLDEYLYKGTIHSPIPKLCSLLFSCAVRTFFLYFACFHFTTHALARSHSPFLCSCAGCTSTFSSLPTSCCLPIPQFLHYVLSIACFFLSFTTYTSHVPMPLSFAHVLEYILSTLPTHGTFSSPFSWVMRYTFILSQQHSRHILTQEMSLT